MENDSQHDKQIGTPEIRFLSQWEYPGRAGHRQKWAELHQKGLNGRVLANSQPRQSLTPDQKFLGWTCGAQTEPQAVGEHGQTIAGSKHTHYACDFETALSSALLSSRIFWKKSTRLCTSDGVCLWNQAFPVATFTANQNHTNTSLRFLT